jgi:hypothetical protein
MGCSPGPPSHRATAPPPRRGGGGDDDVRLLGHAATGVHQVDEGEATRANPGTRPAAVPCGDVRCGCAAPCRAIQCSRCMHRRPSIVMLCWLVLRRPATVPSTTAELGKTVWYDLSSARVWIGQRMLLCPEKNVKGCLVSLKKFYTIDRMFRYIHKVLNIDKKN